MENFTAENKSNLHRKLSDSEPARLMYNRPEAFRASFITHRRSGLTEMITSLEIVLSIMFYGVKRNRGLSQPYD